MRVIELLPTEPPPATSPGLPRSRSEPCLNVTIRQEFIRYRSLRETKKEKSERNNEKGKGKCNGWPIRIDVVSIVSGDQTERSEQEQTTSANANGQVSNGLFANRNRSLVIEHSGASTSTFVMSEDDSKITTIQNEPLLRNSREHLNGLRIELLDEDNVDVPLEYGSDVEHHRFHASTPGGYSPLSYHLVDPFADPLENMEDERRSRTEQWVESTSPGMPDDECEAALEAVTEEEQSDTRSSEHEQPQTSIKYEGIPEVRIDACSEPSASSPNHLQEKKSEDQNENTTTSGKIRVHERGDSLQTEELKSEQSEVSFVSSEMDRRSLMRAQFTSNLDKAREVQWSEIDLDKIERFWEYRYSLDDNSLLPEERRKLDSSGNGEESGDEARQRGPTPTLERVVMYYVGGKPLPSPSPNKRRSRNIFSTKSVTKPTSPKVEEIITIPPAELKPESSQNVQEITVGEEKVENSHVTIIVNRRKISNESASIVIGKVSDDSEDEDDKGDQSSSLNESLQYFRLVETTNEKDIVERNIPEEIIEDMQPLSPNSIRSLNRSRGRRNSSLSATPSPKPSEGPPVIISPPTGFSLVPSPSIPSAISHAGLSPLHSARFISVRSPSSEGRSSTDYVITANKDADDKRNKRETRSRVYKTKTEQARSPSSPHSKTGSSNKAIQVSMIVTPRSTHSNLSSAISSPTLNITAQHRSVSFNDNLNCEISSPKCAKRYNPKAGYRSILKRENTQRQIMRKLMEEVEEKLYNELRLLVEERDRAIHGLEITKSSNEDLYSSQTAYYQTRYRGKLEENKLILDKKIDEAWKRLKELGMSGSRANFVYGVADSKNLTLNARRRGLPFRRHTAFLDLDKKEKNVIELASVYADRLKRLRAGLGRRDSFNKSKDEEETNILSLVDRVGKALSASPTNETGANYYSKY
ncbi:hypothetical protein WR25_15400 [Diploscapter pachys]|uniref:Uncharacterized protein n=1 Tax=Diploscapter pachys TaxID=2018661 RepID=A0A2A2LUK9_9BILA|nr:hypothetical protein WR25_15400 [Diploscapter pachys]